MAIIRRMWKGKSIISRYRRSSAPWLCPYAASSPSQLPELVCPELKKSILGFCTQSKLFRRSSSSAIDLISHRSYLSRNEDFKRCCFSSVAASEQPIDGIIDVPLAQTGEGIAECELLKWFVQEGDHVEEFQPLCEVQSDKATIEITSRYNGQIAQILHAPSDIVKVGETLLRISLEGFQDTSVSTSCLAEADNQPSVQDTIETNELSFTVNETKQSGILSTPAVRGLAKQYGIDISNVQGTGENGRVLKEDVLKYASAKLVNKESGLEEIGSKQQFVERDESYSHASAAANTYADKIIPIRGFQRAMVKSMTMAAKVPHFHYVEEIKSDALIQLKASFQSVNTDPSIKHTFLPILVKSLSMALSKHPLINSFFDEEALEVVAKGAHNIGIAMATPTGLVVPNIKNVQSLSILEITKELSRLQCLATENKLNQEDVNGGTITLSNIGAIGGKFGSPLVNLPEVAIVAIGRIQKIAQFTDDGKVYPVAIMNVNIGADHRVLDGAMVAKFCNEWKMLIEKPELLLLHMR
ncbi:hypothetical protein V2J09_014323 [Rumex salicifolius]